MSNLILVGFMGTGKSAVGKRLAKKLDREYIDLDRKIEKEAGWTIPQIFAAEGEAGFREREGRALREVIELKNHVISTGGGVMLREENIPLLKKSGKLICLTARPDVILQRTLTTLSSRPLLVGHEPRERVEQLLKLRAPFYALADWTIDTSNKNVEQVTEEILCKLEMSKP